MCSTQSLSSIIWSRSPLLIISLFDCSGSTYDHRGTAAARSPLHSRSSAPHRRSQRYRYPVAQGTRDDWSDKFHRRSPSTPQGSPVHHQPCTRRMMAPSTGTETLSLHPLCPDAVSHSLQTLVAGHRRRKREQARWTEQGHLLLALPSSCSWPPAAHPASAAPATHPTHRPLLRLVSSRRGGSCLRVPPHHARMGISVSTSHRCFYDRMLTSASASTCWCPRHGQKRSHLRRRPP